MPAPRNKAAFIAACATRCTRAAIGEPAPTPISMKPSWLEVDAASMRFKSGCASAVTPVTRIVSPPMAATAVSIGAENRGAERINRMTPAATRVAECSKAETGVGPSMASCSQPWNGTCADLPIAARRSSMPIANCPVFAATDCPTSEVPAVETSANTAT